MTQLRLGIVGSGGMARRRARNFSELPDTKVTSIAARNPETGKALADEIGCDLCSDWRGLIDSTEFDAVVVCTHNALHGEIVTTALENGIHVFTEYPIARHRFGIGQIQELTKGPCAVLRVAHSENVSLEHRKLRTEIENMGELIASVFLRLTPGRGARPEVLFNLNQSGPPALFFVYQVYPLIDLFGPAVWVESHASYTDLREDGGYDSFLNTLTVGFEKAGIAQWTWAGGIAIGAAEQFERIVLSGGTLAYENGDWTVSSKDSEKKLDPPEGDSESLEEQFLREVSGKEESWRRETETALHAAEIGIAAEEAAAGERRINLPLSD